MARSGPTRGRRALQSLIVLVFAGFLLYGPIALAVRVHAARAGGGQAEALVVRSTTVPVASSRHGTTTRDRTRLRFDGREVTVTFSRRFPRGTTLAILYAPDAPENAVLGAPGEGWLTVYAANAQGWKTWGLLALGLVFLLLGLAYAKDAATGPDPDDLV